MAEYTEEQNREFCVQNAVFNEMFRIMQGVDVPLGKTYAMLPESVKIGWSRWVVTNPVEDLRSRGRAGETHVDLHEIRIDNTLGVDHQRETLLHEVIHAIGDSVLEYESHLSEQQVRMLAPGMLQVMVDNPEFVRFILGTE